jgi:hypothetical protein
MGPRAIGVRSIFLVLPEERRCNEPSSCDILRGFFIDAEALELRSSRSLEFHSDVSREEKCGKKSERESGEFIGRREGVHDGGRPSRDADPLIETINGGNEG